MFKVILLLGLGIVLWGCQKNGQPSSPKRLKSVSKYTKSPTARVKETDSILYDNNNRMTGCRRMFFDTVINGSGAITHIGFYQSNYIFSYSGSDMLPSSYVITYTYSSNTPHHILRYNTLNQPIQDSDQQQISNIYFSYAPNVIVAHSTSILGASGTRIDSFILQNDNIVTRYYRFPPQNTTPPGSVDQITYSTIANPLYNFNGVGILLYEMFGDFDWVSRNLFTNLSNSNNLGNTSMSWTTDADGNAISGNGSTNGSVVQIIFNYN